MRSRLCWIGLLVVICSGVISGGVTATDHTSQYQIATDQPEPDNTVTRIALDPNGDAVWTIRFRTRLSTSSDVEAYETFQSSFRNNSSQYLSPFEQRMTAVVDGANDQHDREMRAVDFVATTSIQEVPQRWGVVSFQFRWEGFAAQNSDQLVVGDVFAGGLFISEGDVLEIAVPDGYVVTSAEPTPDEASGGIVQWNGREDFADGRPRILVAPDSPLPVGNALFVAAVGLVVAVSLGALAVRRKRSIGHSDQPVTAESTTGAQSTDEKPVDPDTDSTESSREYDLVTNESQVVDILEQHGGQMKQADIVEALEWSKSKTSRVLSEMADEGTVEKLRLGRENVIRLQTDQ